jgi:hypothetical protein
MALGDLRTRITRMSLELEKIENLAVTRVELNIKWSSIKTSTKKMLEWAKKIKYIHPIPFTINEKGSMTGPPWAREIRNARLAVDELLEKDSSFVPLLVYEKFFIFNDLVELTMSAADNSLRDTAGVLNDKSEIVLGSLPDVNI